MSDGNDLLEAIVRFALKLVYLPFLPLLCVLHFIGWNLFFAQQYGAISCAEAVQDNIRQWVNM
jgi:hypothetical protein